jgi:hypothetical protein
MESLQYEWIGFCVGVRKFVSLAEGRIEVNGVGERGSKKREELRGR